LRIIEEKLARFSEYLGGNGADACMGKGAKRVAQMAD
jgi:hypothetical protein